MDGVPEKVCKQYFSESPHLSFAKASLAVVHGLSFQAAKKIQTWFCLVNLGE
jgi:hypothetical protein